MSSVLLNGPPSCFFEAGSLTTAAWTARDASISACPALGLQMVLLHFPGGYEAPNSHLCVCIVSTSLAEPSGGMPCLQCCCWEGNSPNSWLDLNDRPLLLRGLQVNVKVLLSELTHTTSLSCPFSCISHSSSSSLWACSVLSISDQNFKGEDTNVQGFGSLFLSHFFFAL